jgi:hypothetical protein
MVYATGLPFKEGEELKYDVHYKYGFVMLRAGTANYRISNGTYDHSTTYQSVLDFKTSAFFDKIFKIRDTLYSHINENIEPIYHRRVINEGDTKFREEVVFNKSTSTYTEARVKRENAVGIKFDTLLHVNNLAYDLLNIFIFARTLDYAHMKIGESIRLSTFVGRNKVNILVYFEGQTIINKSETLKYNAYKLVLDITDEVFNESKNAMEIWISNDKNRIPLKLKAKLSIGVAEADLTSCKNLKYPFSSEIKIPAR